MIESPDKKYDLSESKPDLSKRLIARGVILLTVGFFGVIGLSLISGAVLWCHNNVIYHVIGYFSTYTLPFSGLYVLLGALAGYWFWPDRHWARLTIWTMWFIAALVCLEAWMAPTRLYSSGPTRLFSPSLQSHYLLMVPAVIMGYAIPRILLRQTPARKEFQLAASLLVVMAMLATAIVPNIMIGAHRGLRGYTKASKMELPVPERAKNVTRVRVKYRGG